MARILVIGIAVVDAVARPVDAFPAPGGLRLFEELNLTTGGCAINCAIALAKLGVGVDLVSRVGRDALGDFVVSEVACSGAGTGGIVRDASKPTSFSFVAVPSGGERSFLHTKGANSTLCPSDVTAEAIAGKSLVFVTGVMLMDALDAQPAAQLLQRAQAQGARTILDTVYVEGVAIEEWNRRVFPSLPFLDYFVPSEAEARELAATSNMTKAARAFQQAGAKNVVIKLGARGVLCLDESGPETLVPAFKVPQVVDTTGAGDCWAAGFLAGLEQGRPLVQAARLGNAVAALSVQAAGATTGIHSMDQVNSLLGV